MKVKRTSWHYRAWYWLHGSQSQPPSFCSYWVDVLLCVPLAAVAIGIMHVVYGMTSILGHFNKPKAHCPFGKIEVEN